jgi:putative glycerol-1-phosphate prenyltransferase
MYDFRQWKHVFKVDPNKEISDCALEQICESGTDAVIVGGSDGVTLDNTLELLAGIRRYSVPCVLEVSTVESISPGFDFYFVPSVLNSNKTEWIVGLHHQAVKEYGAIMNWDEIIMEGYCILNEDSKAAALTGANHQLDMDDIIAYARMAEKMFNFPIFYLEYSGEFGNMNTLKEVKATLTKTKLFYGGGITNAQQAREAAQFADTIVVGNSIYENLGQALETVQAIKE